MANEDQPTEAPGVCSPCRGTGKLISGLGGTPHEVTCPWCQGTGHRIPGLDAQQAPAEGQQPPAEGQQPPAEGQQPPAEDQQAQSPEPS